MYTATESETTEVFDCREHVGTGRGGLHESPSFVFGADVWPGDVHLDPEETDINTLNSLTFERTRLRDLAPAGASVIVGKNIQSYVGPYGDSERCEWQVSISLNGACGVCYADVSGMTLRDACDSALAKFRAEQLDTVASVSAVAEEKAA